MLIFKLYAQNYISNIFNTFEILQIVIDYYQYLSVVIQMIL